MTPAGSVSAVICTLNREDSLIHVLELLKTQETRAKEILVVDQSREHRSETWKYLQDNQDRIRRLTLPHPSTTAARNLALQEVQGEIVLFLDDDVLFQPSLIGFHLENYQDPSIGAVSGKVLYDGCQENDLPWAAKVTASGKYLRNFTSNRRCYVPTLYGCNMSMRREVLEKTGKFDENYWGNFLWEEVDYALQIRKQGYQILYDPRAAVFHVMEKQGGSRYPSPRHYLESTVFNDWYFFFKYIPKGYFPFLLYRQKRTWLRYGLERRGNVLPLFNQVYRAFRLARTDPKSL
jgi:GT2 family glycosyltransferase